MESALSSSGSVAIAIACAILAVLLGAAGVVASVTAGFLGFPLLAASIALFAVAARKIKKDKP
jgi:hypothetical protein